MLLAAALAGYMVSRQLARQNAPVLQSGSTLPAPRQIVAFSLTDQDGQPFGNARLNSAPSLVFFGFTHCPDVCPTTLALMAQLQRVEALKALRILFVTVDPTRDDQQALQRYVSAFGDRITGLRGDDTTLEPLLANFGAARIVEQRPGGDYFVDHSATIFYLNDRGQLSAVFTPPFDFQRLQADLSLLVSSNY